jgi:hypothetical protein
VLMFVDMENSRSPANEGMPQQEGRNVRIYLFTSMRSSRVLRIALSRCSRSFIGSIMQ